MAENDCKWPADSSSEGPTSKSKVALRGQSDRAPFRVAQYPSVRGCNVHRPGGPSVGDRAIIGNDRKQR
jgi:hypothetical protein